MGLTITAYPDVRFIHPGKPDRVEFGLVYLYPCPDESFAHRMDGKKEGLYEYRIEDVYRFEFSYGAYNVWRDTLARFAHGCSARHVWNNSVMFHAEEFYELIDFTDHDGTLGPETCDKLAFDFADAEDRARSYAEEMDGSTVIRHQHRPGDVWLRNYVRFQKALRLGANDGFVKFG